MAGRIPDEVKNRLKHNGLWETFLDERERLHKAGGNADEKADLLNYYIDKCSEEEGDLKARFLTEDELNALKDKRANLEDVSQWVVRSLLMHPDKVDYMTAPDIRAIKYYQSCFGNTRKEEDFLKNVVGKSFIEATDDGEEVFDGSNECKMIKELLILKEEAELRQQKFYDKLELKKASGI